jgi:carbamoylphosphate synthase small subunit
MWSEAQRRGWDALDEAAVRAGGYLAKPTRPVVMEYDYRAMTKYCREKGVSKMDLTEEELKRFEYNSPLVHTRRTDNPRAGA